MSGSQRSFLIVGFLLLILFSWSVIPPSQAQQEEKKEGVEEIQTDKKPEKVVASPQDIREKTGIVVFVVWMWLSIIILVFFLRLKIREADRLYRLRFFSSDKK